MITLQERFVAKFVRGNRDECWPWIACINPDGYGQFYDGNKVCRAHRKAWELANGLIPRGLYVLHRCDSPSCVNPDHLFLGTQADNIADRDSKGRQGDHRGTKNGRVRLTEQEVIEIRRKRDAGALLRELSETYGVCGQLISRIGLREAWTHISG